MNEEEKQVSNDEIKKQGEAALLVKRKETVQKLAATIGGHKLTKAIVAVLAAQERLERRMGRLVRQAEKLDDEARFLFEVKAAKEKSAKPEESNVNETPQAQKVPAAVVVSTNPNDEEKVVL